MELMREVTSMGMIRIFKRRRFYDRGGSAPGPWVLHPFDWPAVSNPIRDRSDRLQ